MNNIELYIHIPFCAKKCSYCDFVSFSCGRSGQDEYIRALKSEIESKKTWADGKKVSSIFIGGGTPSLIDERHITELLDAVRMNYDLDGSAEITIETNPCTLTENKLDTYLESGINRISIGCQSTDNDNLKRIGRLHSFETFMKAYESSISAGFRNINVDMIFALPYQTLEGWKNELRTVAGLDIHHLSAYCLILEEGTPMYEMRGQLEFPDDDTAADMYDSTADILSEYGFARYEISNYCKKGFECRHNLGYWQGVPYIGYGISASSYFDDKRWTNTADMDKYISSADEYRKKTNYFTEINGLPEEKSYNKSAVIYDSVKAESYDISEDKYDTKKKIFNYKYAVIRDLKSLSLSDKYSEFVMLGLRLTKGISCSEFKSRFGLDIFDVFSEELNKHLSSGTLELKDDRICIPEKYLFVSNMILADFV